MLDKEYLKRLITLFPDEIMLLIYKEKKINNFGFRAGSLVDVKKNRSILEQNLLKKQNFPAIGDYIFKLKDKLDRNFKDITNDSVEGILIENEVFEVLIILFVEERKEEFEVVWSNKTVVEKNKVNNTNLSVEVQLNKTNLENTKVLKKLNVKIVKLQNEIDNKDLQFKSKIEEINSKYQIVLKEKQKLISDNNNLKNELKKEQSSVEEFIKKIEIEKSENAKLLMKLQLENEKLVQDNINLNEILRRDSFDNKKLKILIIGQIDSMQIDISNINIQCLEGSEINDFCFDTIDEFYKEIWIINYDLTIKERDILARKLKETLLSLPIKKIDDWNELNTKISRLKKEVLFK